MFNYHNENFSLEYGEGCEIWFNSDDGMRQAFLLVGPDALRQAVFEEILVCFDGVRVDDVNRRSTMIQSALDHVLNHCDAPHLGGLQITNVSEVRTGLVHVVSSHQNVFSLSQSSAMSVFDSCYSRSVTPRMSSCIYDVASGQDLLILSERMLYAIGSVGGLSPYYGNYEGLKFYRPDQNNMGYVAFKFPPVTDERAGLLDFSVQSSGGFDSERCQQINLRELQALLDTTRGGEFSGNGSEFAAIETTGQVSPYPQLEPDLHSNEGPNLENAQMLDIRPLRESLGLSGADAETLSVQRIAFDSLPDFKGEN